MNAKNTYYKTHVLILHSDEHKTLLFHSFHDQEGFRRLYSIQLLLRDNTPFWSHSFSSPRIIL